jgi:UDP-N-acetylmuramoyl-L-alanyl-D-glutamate--2,6-diaminopimelate ligase
LAVINFDDQSYSYLASIAKVPIISYGLNNKADLYGTKVTYSKKGITYEVIGPHSKFQVKSPLIGEFNVYNSLAAITGAMIGVGVGEKHIKSGIEKLSGIPGRMELIDLGQPFSVIVDFAHTPNALRVAINTIKLLHHNKIILIFGSAGLRDKEKRRLMAATSTKLVDISIFTAEDPRTEALSDILKEMAASANESGGVKGNTYFCIEDRGDAIRKGISLAGPGDIVMACGKGHEQSMCFGTIEYPWDDRVAMRAAIAELLKIPGPKMPYLPTQDHKE